VTCKSQTQSKSAAPEATSIDWPDQKPEVACAVLQYLYSDTCSFDRSHNDEVINLAAQVFLNNFKFEALLTRILKASVARWGCATMPFDEKVSMLHRLYLHESLLSADTFLAHSTEQQLGGRAGIWLRLVQASRSPAQLLDISECLMHKLLSWDRLSAEFDAVSEQDIVLTTIAWCCAHHAQQQQQLQQRQQPAALQTAFVRLIELGKLELAQLEPSAVESFVVPAAVLSAEQLLALYRAQAQRCYPWSRALKVGTELDARDFLNDWYMARVLQVTARRVQMHYIGWGSQYDEWISVSSDRLAPVNTHTTGPYIPPAAADA
jgi:mbt repeat